VYLIRHTHEETMQTMTRTPRPGLTAARERRKLSQTALAERAGIHRVQLARYEAGTMTPSVDIALRIAAVLRTSAERVWAPDSSTPGAGAGRTGPEETKPGPVQEGS
jgi:transcriptional regulator with XRE-family HTH domain